jgi:hypothetical protein
VSVGFCSSITRSVARAIQREHAIRRGAPEFEQRENTELSLQRVAQVGWLAVHVGQLAAVGRVHRARRQRVVGARVHIVPPEHLATVKLGSSRFAASHSFSRRTRWFDCRHNHTCDKSRKYQPLPTMPCSLGSTPVTNVDCTEQVTAV